jgi:hypothetical protein
MYYPKLLISCILFFSAFNQTASESEIDLEPYLKTSLPQLVEQIRDEHTPLVIKKRAVRRIIRSYPDQAPDALVEFLEYYGAHFNEFVASLLFDLGRPNSKNEYIIGQIEEKGRMSNKEKLIALSQALSWPGNTEALPTLQRMIKEEWHTAEFAKICIARIKDLNCNNELLKLTVYKDPMGFTGLHPPDIVSRIIRKCAKEATNAALLDSLDSKLWPVFSSQESVYALAWKGNRKLADFFLNMDHPGGRLALAAIRTGLPEVLPRARKIFEKEIKSLLNSETWIFYAFTFPTILGMEAADETAIPSIKALLAYIETERTKLEKLHEESIKRNEPIEYCYITDPGYSIRESILKGFCINPNPKAVGIIRVYKNNKLLISPHIVGLALLRCGSFEGIEVWLDNSFQSPPAVHVDEKFLLYTGCKEFQHDNLTGVSLAEARKWYQINKKSEALSKRIQMINNSVFVEELLETFYEWP